MPILRPFFRVNVTGKQHTNWVKGDIATKEISEKQSKNAAVSRRTTNLIQLSLKTQK